MSTAAVSTTPPTGLAGLIRQAVDSARRGERVKAHALFARITEHDPGNEAAWLWYANTADDPKAVLTGLRVALRINPASANAKAALPAALYRAGVVAAKANEREAAAEHLAEATTLDPANEAAWLWRAGVTDDPAQSLGYLEQVLRLNPENVQALKGAARLRAQLAPPWECPLCGHRPDANHDTLCDECPECGAVITLAQPDVFDGPLVSVNRPRVESAARRLRAALTTAPTAQTAYALGLAYLNLDRADDALRAFQYALQAKPQNAEWRADVTTFLRYRQGEAPPAEVPPANVPTVLVVDDSATVRKMVGGILTAAGYRVAEAADAEQAAQRVRDGGAPALFILDVNMPGTDGFGLCKMLRANPETARTPVMFLTGKTGILNKLHGRWVGAVEYLTKPFETDKLVALVTQLAPLPAARPAAGGVRATATRPVTHLNLPE